MRYSPRGSFLPFYGWFFLYSLSFLDGWNMVEQPIVFLKEFEKFPLSVGLASMPPENPTIQLVCCLLTMIPPLFLFAYYKTELVEGIAIGGEK